MGWLRIVQGRPRPGQPDVGGRRDRPPRLPVRPRGHAYRHAPGRIPRRGHLRPARAGDFGAPAASTARIGSAQRSLSLHGLEPVMTTVADSPDRLSYDLPSALEASEPPEARGLTRDAVRMLVATKADRSLVPSTFSFLPRFLES